MTEAGDPAAHSPSPAKDDVMLAESGEDYSDMGHYDEVRMGYADVRGAPYMGRQALDF